MDLLPSTQEIFGQAYFWQYRCIIFEHWRKFESLFVLTRSVKSKGIHEIKFWMARILLTSSPNSSWIKKRRTPLETNEDTKSIYSAVQKATKVFESHLSDQAWNIREYHGSTRYWSGLPSGFRINGYNWVKSQCRCVRRPYRAVFLHRIRIISAKTTTSMIISQGSTNNVVCTNLAQKSEAITEKEIRSMESIHISHVYVGDKIESSN